MRNIDNSADVLDSRDIIERIAELESELADETDDLEDREEAEEELGILRELAEEGEQNAGDWEYGATLIRDSYFPVYAEQLADDIGAIDSNAGWPLTFIDWEAAADALKMDYSEIDYDGVTYFVRS